MVSKFEQGSNLSFREVKQIARGNWRNILLSLGVAIVFLTPRHGPCPFCGGTDRFRFDDCNGDGTFFCNQCGSGDGIEFAKRISGKTGRELLHVVSSLVGTNIRHYQSPSERIKQQRRQHDIDVLVAESLDVTCGDPAWLYLTETRGIRLETVPNCLRFVPALEYNEQDPNGGWTKSVHPAMLDLMTDLAGNIVGIQRHYLTNDGRKADVATQKKMMPSPYRGANKGASVKLAEPSNVLGVAEGVETALVCWVGTGIPTWAATSAPLLSEIDVPLSVEEVVIFADNDASGTGHEVARRLANRLIIEGKAVKIVMPPEQGTDWADFVGGGEFLWE